MLDSMRPTIPLLPRFLLVGVLLLTCLAAEVPNMEAWRNTHFGDPDGLGAGNDHADADGDGLINLMEYALGLDPKMPGPTTDLPRPETAGDGLRLRYRRSREDISYQVQKSFDLATWSAEGVDQGSGALGETFASIPLGGTEPAFLRLRVKGSGNFSALYNASTKLEPALTVEKEGALHTYFSDRARPRGSIPSLRPLPELLLGGQDCGG